MPRTLESSLRVLTRTLREEDRSRRERDVLAFGVTLTVAAAAAQSIAHLVNLAFFDLEIDAIDVDSDSGAFAWASSVATFGAALVVAQLWLLEPGRIRRGLLPALAAALAFFSLDDMLALHERVSALENEFAGIEHFSRTFWPLVFMPLLAGALVVLWLLSMQMRPRPALALRAGLALLVAAIGLEMISPALFELGFDHMDAPYQAETIVEEAFELAGWMLIATALVAEVFRAAARPAAPG
jgi:hypothetical protein